MILKTEIEMAKAKLSLELSTRLLKDESYVPYERVAPPCELWMNDRRDTKCAK